MRIIKNILKAVFTIVWLLASLYLGALAYNHIKEGIKCEDLSTVYFIPMGFMLALFSVLLFVFPFLSNVKSYWEKYQETKND